MSVYQGFRSVRAGLGASYRLDKNERYVYTQFREPGTLVGDVIGAGLTSTDAAFNYVHIGPYVFQLRNEQANSSVVAESTSDGLVLVHDTADNDGISMTLGRHQRIAANNTTENTKDKGSFVVGTDEFFLKVKLDIVDVSDADQIAVGFGMGAHPVDGDIDTETDYVGFNTDNGQVNIETVLNNAGTTVTDTTANWADNGQHTMEIRVSKTGLCKFLYDGIEPATDITDFILDTGDRMHAEVSVRSDIITSPAIVTVMEWESGLLSSRGLAGITDTFEASQIQ